MLNSMCHISDHQNSLAPTAPPPFTRMALYCPFAGRSNRISDFSPGHQYQRLAVQFQEFEFQGFAKVLVCIAGGVFFPEVGGPARQHQGWRECIPANRPGAGEGVAAGGEVLECECAIGIERVVADTRGTRQAPSSFCSSTASSPPLAVRPAATRERRPPGDRSASGSSILPAEGAVAAT